MNNQERIKIIKIQAGMADPTGRLIPRGVQEILKVEIADEVATYYFKNSRVTKNFALIEIEGDKQKGKDQTVFYLERMGKAIKKYPGKKKEEIRISVLNQLNKFGANIQKGKDK